MYSKVITGPGIDAVTGGIDEDSCAAGVAFPASGSEAGVISGNSLCNDFLDRQIMPPITAIARAVGQWLAKSPNQMSMAIQAIRYLIVFFITFDGLTSLPFISGIPPAQL